MKTGKSSFTKLIQKDRAARSDNKWSGTLLDYLEVVKADPSTANLSHARLYDVIMNDGEGKIDPQNRKTLRLFGDEAPKIYNFFKDE
ncbi:MAG: serine protein kinase, partial [Gammaproteobacteria bacterium]|nr:serine protein kinase [Gammaproteobacteria bacterium]